MPVIYTLGTCQNRLDTAAELCTNTAPDGPHLEKTPQCQLLVASTPLNPVAPLMARASALLPFSRAA
ncbi:hypothetical protein KVMX100_140286 [Klebsiella variicola]|nr:hypothetical protein KVMX100_140286 [Klebsiella variicola]